mmetsp:Transcript_42590/g.83276  ORF Transcript_42590/g.83276 Transcript_42590/m.83276 type:complete len:118 (-) Transcript_42590:118-471(-)
MPSLRSLDASTCTPAPSECIQRAIEAFPHLEELSISIRHVPPKLFSLQNLKRLRLHLTQPPAGAVVPPFELVELVLWKCLSEDCKKWRMRCAHSIPHPSDPEKKHPIRAKESLETRT